MIFPAFCGCESILGRKSTNVFVSFHVPFILLSCSVPFVWISRCIHFPSCSFHFDFPFKVRFIFLSCSFHLTFMSFHFPSLCIEHTGRRKVICSNQSAGYSIRPKARVFITFRYRFCYRIAIVLEACAGCHLQGS